MIGHVHMYMYIINFGTKKWYFIWNLWIFILASGYVDIDSKFRQVANLTLHHPLDVRYYPGSRI